MHDLINVIGRYDVSIDVMGISWLLLLGLERLETPQREKWWKKRVTIHNPYTKRIHTYIHVYGR